MIVVDTSALIAILKLEAMSDVCSTALSADQNVLMSAGTLVEARIVAIRGGRLHDLDAMIDATVTKIIPVTRERAIAISNAYSSWGKGFHPAALNFGDCFAYATAQEFDCPLLFIGDDFSRTDIKQAIVA